MKKTTHMANGAKLFWLSILSVDLYEPNAIEAIFPHLTDEDLWLSLNQAKVILRGGGKIEQFRKIENKFNKIYNETFQARPEWWLELFKSTDDVGQNKMWSDREELVLSLRPPLKTKIRLMLNSKKMIFLTQDESDFFKRPNVNSVKSITPENRGWFAEKALEQKEYNNFLELSKLSGGLFKLWDGYVSFLANPSDKSVKPELLLGSWLNKDHAKAKKNAWINIKKYENWNADTTLEILSAAPFWINNAIIFEDLNSLKDIFHPADIYEEKIEKFLWSHAFKDMTNKNGESFYGCAKKLFEYNIKSPDEPWHPNFIDSISNLNENFFSAKLLPLLLKKSKERNHQWFKNIDDDHFSCIISACLFYNRHKMDSQKINICDVVNDLFILSGRDTWIDKPLKEELISVYNSLPEWTLLRYSIGLKDNNLFRWCLERGASATQKLPDFSVEDIIEKRKKSLNDFSSILTEFNLKSLIKEKLPKKEMPRI